MRRMMMVGLVLSLGASAQAGVFITEWMYKGGPSDNAEFVEFTNFGPGSVDMTGWTFEDSHYSGSGAGSFDLSGFGTVAAGESVILTQDTVTSFRSFWGLSASVKVVGELGVSIGNNLGSSDSIYLIDGSNSVVDYLVYDTSPVQPSGFSANIPFADLGSHVDNNAVASYVGDSYGSYIGTDTVDSAIGNPGSYPVPEPMTIALLGLGGLMLRRRRA